MKKQTKAIHTGFRRDDAYGAIAMPVYHTCAYEFPDTDKMSDSFCGRSDDPDYSRVTNPTVIHFEDRIKALTGALDVVAVNSGMAAISNALITLTSAGQNIVTSRHLFGNTFAFITNTLRRFGIEARCIDLTDLKAVKAAIDDNTSCVFLEIVTNPQLEVADLPAIAAIAHARGTAVVADTTAIPFTEFEAKKLGVDIEIISSTKYISGGATSIGGLIIDYGTIEGFRQRMRFDTLMNLGAYMNPHTAYMQTLGLENLDARYRLQSANALELAQRLKGLKGIVAVNYIGLPEHPYHEIAARQFGPTGGAMMTIELSSEQACYEFLNRLQVVKRATNLFDNKTLAIHPWSTIFGPFEPEKRRSMDVKDTTIRISVGLEDMDDIVDDINQALGN